MAAAASSEYRPVEMTPEHPGSCVEAGPSVPHEHRSISTASRPGPPVSPSHDSRARSSAAPQLPSGRGVRLPGGRTDGRRPDDAQAFVVTADQRP